MVEISPRLSCGAKIYDGAHVENVFGKEVLFLRLPRWMDRKLAAEAKRVDISKQDVIRYLLADLLGGPPADYLARTFPSEQRGDE